VLALGRLDDVDWLPSGNLIVSATEKIQLRLAASRTVSRPDINEMSPSPDLEYVGGMLVKGNSNLKRARIDNYDVRLEAFPGLTELLAAGVFYKRLDDPIEQLITGGTPHVLAPINSAGGSNRGVELELRSSLSRLHRRMRGLSVNANAAFIASEIRIPAELDRELGSSKHPLQGQANSLANAALNWLTRDGRLDATVLFGVTGKRLVALATLPLPDVYQRPTTTLDASVNFAPFRDGRVKLSAKNLLDPRIRRVQGDNEVSGYRAGRSYSIAMSYGW
jgi:TonB-dependent receptor